MNRTKPNTLIIVNESGNIVSEMGASERGRELTERKFELKTNTYVLKAFYIDQNKVEIPLHWYRGQYNDLFLDAAQLPENVRIGIGYRGENPVMVK